MARMRAPDCAILLAAGRGKRLRPWTDHTPKPLLAHAGKPTIDYSVDSLLAAGCRRFCLVVHHLEAQMRDYASRWCERHDGQMVCVTQSQLDGTAGALQSAKARLGADWFGASFVLAATDYLVPPGFYPDLLAAHRAGKRDVTISLKQPGASGLAARSSVRFDDAGCVTEVIEKPAPGSAPSDYAANLVFVLPAGILGLLDAVPASPRGEREVQTAINQWLARHGPATALLQPMPAEWSAPAGGEG